MILELTAAICDAVGLVTSGPFFLFFDFFLSEPFFAAFPLKLVRNFVASLFKLRDECLHRSSSLEQNSLSPLWEWRLFFDLALGLFWGFLEYFFCFDVNKLVFLEELGVSGMETFVAKGET